MSSSSIIALKSFMRAEVCLTFDARSHRLIYSIADYFQHMDVQFRTSLKTFPTSECSPCIAHSVSVLEPFIHHCRDLLQNQVLPRAAQIFSPVKCAVMPSCVIDADGSVCLEVEDFSHLAQVDQFLLQKCFGSGQLFDLVEQRVAPVFFSRRIAIGRYSGSDSERFQRRVEGVLRRMCDQLPLLTATHIAIRDRCCGSHSEVINSIGDSEQVQFLLCGDADEDDEVEEGYDRTNSY